MTKHDQRHCLDLFNAMQVSEHGDDQHDFNGWRLSNSGSGSADDGPRGQGCDRQLRTVVQSISSSSSMADVLWTDA